MSRRIAQRVRKVGSSTLRSVQHIVRLARLSGNEADFVAPALMLAELRSDNEQLVGFMRDAHFVCGGVDDVASIRRGPERVVDADWFNRHGAL
jgi:starvation-inducible DNA-binding protein